MSPEERAEKLAWSLECDAHVGVGKWFAVGFADHTIFYWTGTQDQLSEEMAKFRQQIANAIRAAEADVLRLDLGEPPVSEEYLREVRAYISANPGASHLSLPAILCEQIDHQQRLIAALMREPGDYQAGYEAGKAAGRSTAFAELLEAAGSRFGLGMVDDIVDLIAAMGQEAANG